jgi:hypothetical protein
LGFEHLTGPAGSAQDPTESSLAPPLESLGRRPWSAALGWPVVRSTDRCFGRCPTPGGWASPAAASSCCRIAASEATTASSCSSWPRDCLAEAASRLSQRLLHFCLSWLTGAATSCAHRKEVQASMARLL